MKNQTFLFSFLLMVFFYTSTTAQETVNGGFELSNQTGMARNWITDDGAGNFSISLDQKVFRSGHQSLQVTGLNKNLNKESVGIAANVFGSMSATKINTIQVSGWIKSREELDSTVSVFVQSGARIIRSQQQERNEKGWTKVILNYNTLPTESWYMVYYGVELRSNRSVWLDDLSLTVNGKKINDPESLYQEPNPKSLKWLQDNLSVLTSVDTAHAFEDLNAIGNAIKNAKIVGIGEATHGTSEFSRFKIRLLEYLVKEKGFTTLALEESIATCDQMNRLLNLPSAALRGSLLSMPFYKTWKTEEMLGLFTWLNHYNLSQQKKIRFIGVDMEDLGLKNSRKMLREYGRSHNEKILAQTIVVDQHLDSLLQLSKLSMSNRKTLDAANKLKQKIASLDSLIVAEGKMTGDEQRLFQLRSYARVCKQWLDSRFFAGSRDEFMADNMLNFLKANPEDKILLWAHNFHIANTNAGGQKTMGAYLKERLAGHYFPIAMTSDAGTYMAAENYSQKKWVSFPMQKAYKGTYEYYLGQVKPNNYFLSLLKVDQKPNSFWLDQPMRQLNLAYIYSGEDEYSYHGTLKSSFDGLVFLGQTSASKSLLN
ncbi:erythromycin esterase family protein [Pedobacter gandavensis]|uniref:Erythromycin esterase family protein n=1 Tax=Pedobacter gandavensis TaxID=2679963 RepID=A0ABR6ES31_9SPHI|nr:erythromycin esterase family protein [Pedobacter gandavensis]MBB2148073.1 hypothetical protein [Pedobacter gandavensis]